MRDSGWTYRYSAAVGQLGSESMNVRFGGIYALEQLIRDSKCGAQTVVEVLCAFVRGSCAIARENHLELLRDPNRTGDVMSIHLPPRVDVAAALTVLGRLPKPDSGFYRIDLRECYMPHVNLDHANLPFASFRGAFLIHADFSNADLNGVDFRETEFAYAKLVGANLTDADFTECHIRSANLRAANLTRANLTRTDLGTSTLTDATMTGANFYDVNLNGATLVRTDLSSIDLSSTARDDRTRWPEGFTPPPRIR